MKEIFESGHWLVEYDLEDGARLGRLCYQGSDLLTTKPREFTPPSEDYGKYETRPVYGYDDCFPSVEVSNYPGLDWTVPDHGELCWLKWKADIESDKIIFSVESEVLPIHFQRTLHFLESQLTWSFNVQNKGEKLLPFQHVIHPLIKLTEIKTLQFPDFASLNNEAGEELDLTTSNELSVFLLSRKKGETYMLYLQSPEENSIQWTYKNGLRVQMKYPNNLFTSIGIWWNHLGYPDEDGCGRDECAFEPIPGSSSKLEEAVEEGRSQWVEPGDMKSWDIVWSLDFE